MRTKQINMLHTDKWEEYPFHTRISNTTRPHLGANMYAEERKKPTPPWKPNTVEDAELEKIRAEKAKVAEELAAKNKTNE